MGKAGNPRKLGVPGEKQFGDRIHHKLLDPDDHTGQHLLIIGAGDVAAEAAIALAEDESNTVTMSAIDEEFTYPKKRNIDKLRALEEQGKAAYRPCLKGHGIQGRDSDHGDAR